MIVCDTLGDGDREVGFHLLFGWIFFCSKYLDELCGFCNGNGEKENLVWSQGLYDCNSLGSRGGKGYHGSFQSIICINMYNYF